MNDLVPGKSQDAISATVIQDNSTSVLAVNSTLSYSDLCKWNCSKPSRVITTFDVQDILALKSFEQLYEFMTTSDYIFIA